MRHAIARALRALATRLDGMEIMDAELNRTSVRAMNAYIGRSERYVAALEDELESAGAQGRVLELRRAYARAGTRAMLKAGAWPEAG